MGKSKWERDIGFICRVNIDSEDKLRYGSPAALLSMHEHEPHQDSQVKQLPLLDIWTTPVVYTGRLRHWVTVYAQHRTSPRNKSSIDMNKSPAFVSHVLTKGVQATLTVNLQPIRGDGHRDAVRWSIFMRLWNFLSPCILRLQKQIYLCFKLLFSLKKKKKSEIKSNNNCKRVAIIHKL